MSAAAVVQEILSERYRQVEREGWSAEHDDKHASGELALAAATYCVTAVERSNTSVIEKLWPWDWSWFKPGTDRRDLVRACALIVAEIERLDRKNLRRAA